MLRVLLAGGGTAGHINPALAIAEIIKKHYPDCEAAFAGNPEKLEAQLVPKAGYKFYPIQIEGFQRHLSAENIKRNFHAAACLAKSSSRAKAIVRDFKPDLVIGTGGYVSGPVVRAAAKLGVKTAIHEQNAFPGVTNKLLAKEVDEVMLTVKEAEKYFPDNSKMTVTGLPVRNAFNTMSKEDAKKQLGFDPDEICVLSTGGSLGAQTLNEKVAALLRWYQDNGTAVNHVHSYGTYKGYKDFVLKLEQSGVRIKDNSRLIIKDYINMPVAMAAADLVISRCGAASLAELEAVGRASVLIPSPHVAENHQYYNGMVLQNAGAATVIEEKDLTDETFIKTVRSYIEDRDKLEKSAENARKLHVADTEERIFSVLKGLIEK
jgi:UDP-N-acetylglucosamine--N-acetylmuramyl-(pentapeptide) pyrophosphoryl-undecaprenol N-acetylglucosamine transferase